MDITYNEKASNEATERVKKLMSEINDMKQNRSDFALTHFVVMQHDMVGRQRLQVLDELEAMTYAVWDMKDEISLALLDIKDLQEKGDDRSNIAISQKQRNITRLQMQVNSHTREIATLLNILDQLPPYTREQFEAEESEYWQARLSRQALLSQRGAYTGMGEGNLEAILELTAKPGDTRKMADPRDILSASLTPADTPKTGILETNANKGGGWNL